MERLIKIDEVRSRVGLSRSAIYRMMAQGGFPMQVKQGNRAAAWVDSEIEAWIQRRIEESRS